MVWVISAGRLKRCSPHQLRHCSEKERIIAEASDSVSMPWSFTSLLQLVEKGQYQRYDDVLQDEDRPEFRERESRARSATPGRRVRSRSRPKEAVKEAKDSQRPQKEPNPKKGGDQETGERRPTDRGSEPAMDRTDQTRVPKRVPDLGNSGGLVAPKTPKVARVTRPSSVAPTTPGAASSSCHGFELERNRQFIEAQQRLEASAPSEPPEQRRGQTLHDLLHDKSVFAVQEGEPVEQIFTMSVDLPETKKDMKSFVKDSSKWVQNKMKKGVELQWRDIPADRLADFQMAKQKEINNWRKEKAIKLIRHEVPKSRVMRMRWIYTLKHDQSAKARLVIIGFQDPDLTTLATTAPVMSRRTRGLFLTLCSCRKWTALKADVRAAFLQGRDSEEERQVFVKPVVELSEQLGGDRNSIAQIVKACYGLANAPAQWYASVAETMQKAGFTRLRNEPCAWRITDEDGQVIGAACAHVDDFLLGGESNHPRWQAAMNYLFKAFSWSDWEADSFQHCGLQVIQQPSGMTILNHAEYWSTAPRLNRSSCSRTRRTRTP